MSAPTLPSTDPARPPDALAERAASYAAQASGPGTRRAYRSAWRAYAAWCDAHGHRPLAGDPQQLARYLTQRADEGLAVASLQVARAAIRAAHRLAGVALDRDDPTLALVMQGIVRSKGVRARRQAAPAVPDVLRRLLAALPSPATPAAAAPALAARHRAMLLIGFGAALRRSEIVALTIGDITIVPDRGLSVLVRRSKTDQHGQGRSIAIWANPRDPAFCPLVAFERWIGSRIPVAGAIPQADALAAMADQPLFCGITSAGAMMRAAMSDKVVARLMKQACTLAGIDPARFSGHSLRRGLLTAAGDLQLPLADLMRQSRHRSVATALTYLEPGDAWRNNITQPVMALPDGRQGGDTPLAPRLR